MTRTITLWLAVSVALGCGSSPGASPDATVTPPADATAVVTIPSWRLEDVQPQSPRTGQTYGLDAFSGMIVVVALVEGF